MKKNEFLEELDRLLVDLPEAERERSVEFYSEMIDDRIEDGETEETAVAGIGSPELAAEEIIDNVPFTAAVRSRVSRKRVSLWTVVFAVMASPIWLPLLIAAAAVIFSVYVSVWAVVISFAAAAAGIAAGAVGGAAVSVIMLAEQPVQDAVFIFGCALMLAGISIFLFFAVKQLIKEIIRFTVWMIRKTKFAVLKRGRRDI